MNNQWYWCERDNTHWQGDKKCPVCFSEDEVRETMPMELADQLGLTNND